MKQGKEYLVTLAQFPSITVKLGWGNIRDEKNAYNLDIKDVTTTHTPAAHVFALQNNPFEPGNYGPVPEVKLVLKNADPDKPGESIRVTVITAL